jgi:ATP-dependent 26S proteasome regulatory subunit
VGAISYWTCQLPPGFLFITLPFAGRILKAPTAEPVKVTGTIIKTTTEEGAAASYQPFKTAVVREDRSNSRVVMYSMGRGHVVNETGDIVQTAIKPGTRVRVHYANSGDLRMIDQVVVID